LGRIRPLAPTRRFGQEQPFELESPDLLLKFCVASRDTMTSIAELVKEHPEVFVGAVRSTPEIVSEVERSLNVELPSDMVWFLTSCGAASTGAVSNEHAVVANTVRYRKAVGLPNHFVVLDERNDAGTVFLDAESGAVAWVDAHAVSAFARGVIQVAEYDAYPNFSAWVADCIREIED
jgi:hypothetical protein